jgi:B12-binding domain/radical SAM domain protein
MKKKKIILVGGRINRHSLISIAGIIENLKLKENIHIQIKNFDQIQSTNISKDTIIFFTFFSGQVPETFRALEKVKEKYPKVLCIAGGPHASGAPEQTLKSGFDYVIRGEGEESIPLLLQMCEGQISPENVSGLSYQQNNKFIHNDISKFICLDSAFNYSAQLKTFFPIEITRGCPYSCNFCQVTSLFGKKYRHRTVDSILSYINRGQNFIRFISTNAFAYGSNKNGKVNHSEISKLLVSIRKKDKKTEIYFGSFPSEVRPEYVDDEIIRIVKKFANNKTIALGAQSGSNRLLKLINRRHKIEDVLLAAEKINLLGLKCKVDFIFGLPGETDYDLQKTFKIINKLRKMNVEIRLHTFIPLPGTTYVNAPSGYISENTKSFLLKLIGNGEASGPWKNKTKINANLASYYKKKCVNYS